MSLVKFSPKNHPQQVDKRGLDDEIDERYTLTETFGPLSEEFGFTLDAAATAENAKCPLFFDRTVNGLVQSWAKQKVWCNPPFSDLEAWVRKARCETFHGGCPLVVMLLPANRSEQPWWQDYIEPVRDRGIGVSTRNLRKRRNFGRPGQPDGKYPTGVPFGLVIVIFENTAGRPSGAAELSGLVRIGSTEGMTWQDFLRKRLIKFNPKERALAAARIKREIMSHNQKTNNTPLKDTEPHPLTGLSWQFLAMIASARTG